MLAGLLSTAVSGLNVNSRRINAAANNIVNVSSDDYKRSEINSSTVVSGQTTTNFYAVGGVQAVPRQLTDDQGTDIGSEFATLVLSRNAYSASLKALSAAEDMSATLFDAVV